MPAARLSTGAAVGLLMGALVASSAVVGTSRAEAAPGDTTVVLGGNTWTKVVGANTNPKSGAHMMLGNVDTDPAGNVVITTMRHCGNVGSEGQSEHPASCPNPADTWYSSGRLHLDDAALGGVNFTASVTATLPAATTPGTRHALWMTNGNYCSVGGDKTYLGEFDLVEQYGSKPAEAQANTHITCKDKVFVSADTVAQAFRPGQQNTWTVSRTGNAISYTVNGAAVADYTCGVGAFSPSKLADNGFPNTSFACEKSLNRTAYRFILQGEVFKPGGSKAFTPPSASATFPTTRMVVADARVSVLPGVNSPADLFALNKNDGGLTAVHRLQKATRFQAFSTQVRTAHHLTTDLEWQLLMGDYDGDGVQDMYAVQRNDSGRTAVHILDGASNYQTYSAHYLTPLPATTDPLWSLDVADFNGDNRDDLFAMYKNDGGMTAVHVVDAASGFQQYSEQIRTALHETTSAVWALQAGDYDGDGRADLYALNRSDSGRTAVHVLSAATRFQSFSEHVVTSMPETTNPWYRLDVGDYDGDGRGDLYATFANDAGKTAVHVVPASTRFQGFSEQVRTAAGDTSSSLWDVLVAAP